MHFQPSSHPGVRRLSGLDAIFLNLEMPTQPMQNLALALLRPGDGSPLSLDQLHEHLLTRLDQIPPLRWRVIPVPFGLAHPVVADDPRVDLGQHLSYQVLPDPGGPAELDAACARLLSRCLDRDRPLWRITLIDGLADGRQALALEVHHALMDGVAIRATLARIFPGDEPAAVAPSRQLGREPGRSRLFMGALAHNARIMVRLPDLISRTLRASAAVRRRREGSAVMVPQAGVDTPRSAINEGSSSTRRVTRTSLPLGTALAVSKAAGVTVNDVALATVGGALRGYLQERGALPDRPLVAFVPVGTEPPGIGTRTAGNRFAHLSTSLATDVADPRERLRRISAVTTEAKALLDLSDRRLVADWLEGIPPMLMNPIVRRSSTQRSRPQENVVVSNLRGPAAVWQLRSTVVEEVYLTPPGNAAGVNFAFWDYADRLMFGILSTTDSVDDLTELAERLSSSLEELVVAVDGLHRVHG
ncbi:MAG: wax ester/triacylglycerol synthase family O-acyltransferase [Pseudonocardiaceae bacterium]